MASFLVKRCRLKEKVESALVTQTPGHQVGRQSHKYNQSVLITPINLYEIFAREGIIICQDAQSF